MFLRFGFAVGNVGLIGTIAIVLIGHLVTIPTAMAIAEIATNQKVEGGGEYYIISRSFGLVIGSTIGIALYFSQAISVAFYIIAFAEAFTPVMEYLSVTYGAQLPAWANQLLGLKQTVSIPALFLLTLLILTKGADLGVKALYVVVFTLFVSLVAFFVGTTEYSQTVAIDFTRHVGNTEGGYEALGFFAVFAIIFPAFTGMTAGVGLSGDLKNPSKSIPLGTLAGTLAGMVIYVFIAYKLAVSASPLDLANTDKLVMADIAWQGWWIIPLGLAAATISSALGSIMVAPRTLQAIARDRIIPSLNFNGWLSRGRGKNDEPFNATVVTIALAFVFVFMGELDAVAQIISMFFMVTYGSLCLISFLQHFAADPSYRPTFKSKWYLSLMGALACFGLMFFMNAGYAMLSIVFIIVLYFIISYYNSDKNNLALIFQGVIFQMSRRLQVFLQKADKEKTSNWRPSVVCISESSFQRFDAFNLLRWIAQKYGFGTYIHKIDGYLSKKTKEEANVAKGRLIKMAEASQSNVFIDSMITPSYTSAIAQVIQLPGVSGKENNMLLLEFSRQEPDNLKNIIENFNLIRSVEFDVAILSSCQKGFGFRRELHIWITSSDYENANLMILLGYIITGHPDWSKGEIKIFAVADENNLEEEKQKLSLLIEEGRIPISSKNINIISRNEESDTRALVQKNSTDADLTLLGFHTELVKRQGEKVFEGYEGLGAILFVNAADHKHIE